METFGRVCFVGGRSGFSAADDRHDFWQPAADLLEVEGGFLVQMDLPGIAAQNVEVSVDGRSLTVRGVRHAPCPGSSKRYVHMEVCRGEFTKVISLPSPVSPKGATACLEDGVLEIFLPFGNSVTYTFTTLTITRAL